jgi:hypothetical protein
MRKARKTIRALLRAFFCDARALLIGSEIGCLQQLRRKLLL